MNETQKCRKLFYFADFRMKNRYNVPTREKDINFFHIVTLNMKCPLYEVS